MFFQSIVQREGWKSQNLFAKILCHKCLSRRVPYTYRLVSTIPPKTVAPKATFLKHFRDELYHPENHSKLDPSTQSSSSIVKITINRKAARKRLLKSYTRLKKKSPQQLAELTREDIDQYILRFTVHSDNLVSKRPMMEAFYILKDLKVGKFAQISFGTQEAERMVCLAAELKMVDKAPQLLKEFTMEKHLPLRIQAYDAVLQLLSEKEDMAELEFWLSHLETKKMELTDDTIRSVVMCYLSRGQLESAALFAKKNCVRGKLALLVQINSNDNQELIERVLNYYASQALANRKLNLAKTIYVQKTKLGMNSFKKLKQLISRCIHRREFRTAEIVLDKAISLNDTRGAQLCSEYLINSYLSEGNISHSLAIWDKMVQNEMKLSQDIMNDLLIRCAKSKYHVDVLRLYQNHKEIYPNLTLEAQVYIVRCMVFSKEITKAKTLSRNLIESMPNMNAHLAELAARSLLSLSAKSGDLGLFERTFKQVEGLNLDLRHKGLTTLAACYLKRNDVPAAKEAFRNIIKHTDGPDVVDFNVLIRTVLMEDKTVDHQKILEILKHMALVNITPDHTTMRTMLKYYEPNSTMLPELYKKLLKLPLRRSDQVYLNNIAISKLLINHDIQDIAGRFLFNDKGLILPNQRGNVIERDGITYKILLVASLKKASNSSIAERLMKDMIDRNIKPPRKLYESFIQVLCQQGKISKARSYIEQMEKNTGEKPNQKTYTKIVDGLYKISKPELAKQVILEDIDIDTYDRAVRRRLDGPPQRKH